MLEDFVHLHPEALGEALPEEKQEEGAGDGQQGQAHPPVLTLPGTGVIRMSADNDRNLRCQLSRLEEVEVSSWLQRHTWASVSSAVKGLPPVV